MTARQQFRSVVKGENFMTPEIVSYVDAGNYVIEVSKGDFMNKMIYGVTVVMKSFGRQPHLSKMVDSLEEAEAYIKRLENEKRVLV